MVKDLMSLIPFEKGDRVLDAGSGKNKIWYKNIPKNCISWECEIEDGKDFLKEWNVEVDWVIGNPPFRDNAPDGERVNLVPLWILIILTEAELVRVDFFKAVELLHKEYALKL
jgi:hypothetical protein